MTNLLFISKIRLFVTTFALRLRVACRSADYLAALGCLCDGALCAAVSEVIQECTKRNSFPRLHPRPLRENLSAEQMVCLLPCVLDCVKTDTPPVKPKKNREYVNIEKKLLSLSLDIAILFDMDRIKHNTYYIDCARALRVCVFIQFIIYCVSTVFVVGLFVLSNFNTL